MIIVKKIADLRRLLDLLRARNQTIGFVPTMGALHKGHLSLINQSLQNSDCTVCSIFVNPTQFNNSSDFEKYPITIEKDINMLEASGCHVLFLPSVAEMYPAQDPVIGYELGYVETILEGKYRPGHFQGVCRIVDKLLNATRPHQMFLGQKDYQQCMVIKKMMSLQNHEATLHICDTLREPGGLAMSSRNMRLSPEERTQATAIFETLTFLKQNLTLGDLRPLLQQARAALTSQGFEVDYVAIAAAGDLTLLTHWDGSEKIVALIAASLNEVRLIDNLFLKGNETGEHFFTSLL